MRVYNALVEGQHRIRYLMRVGTSLAEADDTCRSIALFILAIIPLIALTQSLISWITAGSVLRPLEQINAAVKQISILDPSRRLPLRRQLFASFLRGSRRFGAGLPPPVLWPPHSWCGLLSMKIN